MRPPRSSRSLSLSVALLASLSARVAAAQTPPSPPMVVTLEGVPDETRTEVLLRAPGSGGATVRLGTVTHVAGSALRGAVLPGATADRPLVLVVAQVAPSRNGASYNSALFRVDGGGTEAVRLCDGLTDVSAPLVTARGTVLVQRGTDGPEPPPDDSRRTFTERRDALRVDAVDVRTGSVRSVWQGGGQIAFLAAALRDDEAAVYHVDGRAAPVLALDASTGRTRTLLANAPLARDFSFEPSRGALVFARLSPSLPDHYDVVSLRPYHSLVYTTVLHSAPSDHLMPRVLRDGTVGVSLSGDRGLGWVDAFAPGSPASMTRAATTTPYRAIVPRRAAPLGDGRDAVLAESPDGRWVALRHATSTDERFVVLDRVGGATLALPPARSPQAAVELLGFAPARGAR